jgi:hypothetical protein
MCQILAGKFSYITAGSMQDGCMVISGGIQKCCGRCVESKSELIMEVFLIEDNCYPGKIWEPTENMVTWTAVHSEGLICTMFMRLLIL